MSPGTGTLERLLSGYSLIEGPTVEDSGALLFADVEAGGVRRLLADGTVEDVIPHRRGIGGMALHADGGCVVSGRNVAWKRGEETVVLHDRQHGGQSFNDLTTDPEGRIYVGSLEFNPLEEGVTPSPGQLYLIDLDGSVRVVSTGIQLTNGLGVSPDGDRLYHSDTAAHTVWRYDRHPDGSLDERLPLHTWDETGQPDGLAVAEDGSVWVAMAFSGHVAVLAADGALEEEIPVEVPMVTSVAFGGEDRRDLYVVTGARGAPDGIGGGVYRMRAPVAGLALAKARVVPRAGHG